MEGTYRDGIIAVEGMLFHAYHGFYAEERHRGGQFRVDVYLTVNLLPAAETDKLDNTVNYESISDIARRVMDERHHLLEHLAYRVLEEIGREMQGVRAARVRISKLHPPLPHYVERVFVELEKSFDYSERK
ncbi:MAG: 7,8-dihydroneopterin aldolase [Chitinophagales bacterium]|nr:MAG: 7,8-dihydroneopterin aldolase [Chitinophagales bacterium]